MIGEPGIAQIRSVLSCGYRLLRRRAPQHHREMAAITALGRDGGRLWKGDPDTTGFM